MELDTDTAIALLAGGVMFLWALVLGVQKYAQIRASPDGHAHPYTDIAHRAALLYSFAFVLIAAMVAFGAWSATVNVVCVAILAAYFVQAVAGYMVHGLRKDTVNQFTPPVPGWMRLGMVTLIVAEIGAFAVLLAGFVSLQFLA
ncbi:MAG TPA: hypothetical protein VM093_06170 [Aeromicrobium sp.]|nr:hypothetical protein [Aeromicrobium sp.]